MEIRIALRITAENTAMMMDDFGSASKNWMERLASPPISALLINESSNTFLRGFPVRLLKSLDDLIHPIMGVQHLLGQDLSPDPIELAEDGEHDGRCEQHPCGSCHARTILLKSLRVRLVPYCLPDMESLAMTNAITSSFGVSGSSTCATSMTRYRSETVHLFELNL